MKREQLLDNRIPQCLNAVAYPPRDRASKPPEGETIPSCENFFISGGRLQLGTARRICQVILALDPSPVDHRFAVLGGRETTVNAQHTLQEIHDAGGGVAIT